MIKFDWEAYWDILLRILGILVGLLITIPVIILLFWVSSKVHWLVGVLAILLGGPALAVIYVEN